MGTKTPSWAKWMLVILLAGLVIWIYQLVNSNNNVEIQDNKTKKESLQKDIDTISNKEKSLVSKAKGSAKSYTDRGNIIIKEIYYEKPIVLPAADSVGRYIAAYKFAERK